MHPRRVSHAALRGMLRFRPLVHFPRSIFVAESRAVCIAMA